MKKSREYMTRNYFNKYVTVRKWDKPVERSYCNPSDSNDKNIKFIANITFFLDMYCGGNTEEEAKENLFIFINNANHMVNI